MNMDVAPETTIEMIMALRFAGGKLRSRFSDDQSSRSREQTRRTGMVRRLL